MQKSVRKKYSEAFELEVLRGYYSSGMSMYAIAKKWGLPCFRTFLYWKERYRVDSEEVSLPPESFVQPKMKKEKEPVSREEHLEAEVLRLRKAMEVEKLRSYAFQKLIESTEKEEGISILKKDGVKQ